MHTALVREINGRLEALEMRNAATLHRIRREFSKRVRELPGESVTALAQELSRPPAAPGARMVACGLVGNHPGALARLTPGALEQLAGPLESWGDVDMFACLLAGVAWRDGAIQDRTIMRWARSSNRFWRRAALASTVPLNVKSRGGRGDPERTLRVCGLLLDDRDDTVVKALSWALRELATRDAQAVEAFVQRHADRLAARVLREVRNKLATGLKNPTPASTAIGPRPGAARTRRRARACRHPARRTLALRGTCEWV